MSTNTHTNNYFLFDKVSNDFCLEFTYDDKVNNTDKWQYVKKCMTTMRNCYDIYKLIDVDIQQENEEW